MGTTDAMYFTDRQLLISGQRDLNLYNPFCVHEDMGDVICVTEEGEQLLTAFHPIALVKVAQEFFHGRLIFESLRGVYPYNDRCSIFRHLYVIMTCFDAPILANRMAYISTPTTSLGQTPRARRVIKGVILSWSRSQIINDLLLPSDVELAQIHYQLKLLFDTIRGMLPWINQ